MKHNIQAFWIPSTKEEISIQVGNDVEVGGVTIGDYSITDLVTRYLDNGIGRYFMCCEIKSETTAREQYSRDVYGVHDVMYINAAADFPFKEDDIIIIPADGGRYRVVATDNAQTRPIKNGFRTQNITINITMVKQDE